MLVFIDTEVDLNDKRIKDYGAVKEDGSILHTRSASEFYDFISKCDTLCGHNIINHDLKYLKIQGKYNYIDTLPLSPLLFPKKPYHKLLKDDKLQVDEFNNPLNDAQKSRDLFYDEVAAWKSLSEEEKIIYKTLLKDSSLFEGFFNYIDEKHILDSGQSINSLIKRKYQGLLCGNAKIDVVAKKYPIELAFSLSLIGVDDILSITPGWVMHNYPKVGNVMNYLRNTTCDSCEYCKSKLDSHRALKDFFGYDEFRIFDGVPMQEQAVNAAIHSESILTIFPTGGGKSLTFQLPALIAGRNIHGLTVVISPLQSLMKDQVDNMIARGISDAVTINGLLDPIERSSAIAQVLEGKANLLYIAPESLRSKTIERLLLSRNVIRFVIDEAHCFSAWGQDFRTDYLYIGDFIKKIQKKKLQANPIAVSCFTATAKQKVISDICDYFKNKLEVNLKIFAANAERKNLHYTVIHTETEDIKYTQLRNLVTSHKCPTIVYVSRTKRTKELADHLCKDGFTALPFNGRMESAEKVKNQNAFMTGEAQIIIATSAFGMGVDKKDVGLVVHYDISDSLENYVQEAGRAGRDPHMEADCYVLYSDNDLDKHFILLNQTKLSISEIQQVWQAIKNMTKKHEHINCSPLEIAREAGWVEDNGNELETRVKGAVTALEEAGFIHRGSNSPQVFATGIQVRTMDEARDRLTKSSLFDERTREQAVRIIHSLISSRATAGGRGADAESRIDYLADMLGLTKETVVKCINLMRQEGILADVQDMQAYIDKKNVTNDLTEIMKIERILLEKIDEKSRIFNYKQLNTDIQSMGIKRCTVKKLRTLLHFLFTSGYIYKQEHFGASASVKVYLQNNRTSTISRFEKRAELCRFIANRLAGINLPDESKMITFSMVELLELYNISLRQNVFSNNETLSLADMEEALLYMSRTGLLKIEGGFMVIYSSMSLHRCVERKTHYRKEHYRLLDDFYRQRIQQIHIVGEYANMMVRNYDAAMQFVSDYFLLDYQIFINKYFKEEKRRSQILKNITPAKYNKIFGSLSKKQQVIINDKQSKYIVVAAGPGSGKTMVLVHKLASLLLMEDVKHEQLLMLTFSRAAATEFKKRLIDLVEGAAYFVDIKTFHSYSFDLIGKQGTIEEVDSVVRRAAEMIENGEVEENKIAKSVLVIDEAQDMSADEFRLVQALMHRNEDMRVIAVGDDDQNIFAFRGSDSTHMRSLVEKENAKLYEMTENYRSAISIVEWANRFVRRIPNRMKTVPIRSVTDEKGSVQMLNSFNIDDINLKGTTAILTRTNEESLQVAYNLEKHGLHATVVQSMGGFRFGNLAEIRFFLKQLNLSNEISISKEKWVIAKQHTLGIYANSRCIDIIRLFFAEYEATHKVYYVSDLQEYIFESNIEDFIKLDGQSIFISTIHKAKGREFDNVYLMSPIPNDFNTDKLRPYYVGITRAKRNLYIINNPSKDHESVLISLNMHDVWLDFFKARKKLILSLRSGELINYKDGYLINSQNEYLAALSNSGKKKIKEWQDKGYEVSGGEISYTLAWRPQECQTEYAVCLANIVMTKTNSAETI